MPLNQIDPRVSNKYDTTSKVPYIGPSNDHTDGSWTQSNAIYPGEYYQDMSGGNLHLGFLNNTYPIPLVGTGSYQPLLLSGGTMSGSIELGSSSKIYSTGGTVSGSYIFAYGDGITSISNYSWTGGKDTTNSAPYSLVHGLGNNNNGDASFLIGSYHSNSHDNSAIIAGTGISSVADNTLHTYNIRMFGDTLIVPYLTTTERQALTPVNGMVVCDSTLDRISFYSDGSWYVCTATAES